jgi:hypothetical protein
LTRFDPWQNRPDRPRLRWQPGRLLGGGPRAVAIWLAMFAILTAGYSYGHDIALAGWHTLAQLLAGPGR